MRREVERAFNRLRRRFADAQLLDLLERGDVVALGRNIKRLERDLEAALKTLQVAFEAGRVIAAQELPLKLRQSLQQTNPFAIKAAERNAARFVTGVSHETRVAIRSVVAAGFRNGLPPRQMAKAILPSIGLTRRQAQAVVKFSAGMRAGTPEATARARVDKYAAKLLKQRSMMIARTEIIKASTEGQLSLWREAQAKGLLPAGAEKVWITTPDDRLCPVCEALDGETVRLGGMFQTELGPVSGPPAHPNCRCALGIAAKSVGVRSAA